LTVYSSQFDAAEIRAVSSQQSAVSFLTNQSVLPNGR
jgi:hypothetical protein